MTIPNPSRRVRANGDGTVYQRKDGRWEAAGYVLAPGNTRKRVRLYGSSRKDALAKLTEKVAASNRGLPVVTVQGSLAAFLTYWLENVACERTPTPLHRRRPALPDPGPGRKKLAKLTAKDVRTWLNQLRTTCQCCARPRRRPRPTEVLRHREVLPQAALRAGPRLRALRTQVRTGARRPRRGDPPQRPHGHAPPPALRTPHHPKEARTFLAATSGDRLQELFQLALRTGLGKGELLGLHWEDLDLDASTAQHPPHPPAHQLQRPDCPPHQDPELGAPHRPAHRVPALPRTAPRPAASGARGGGCGLEGKRLHLHPARRQPDRGSHPHPALKRPAPPGRAPPHPLP